MPAPDELISEQIDWQIYGGKPERHPHAIARWSAQLGRVIATTVQSEIVKEQRPGGLLARG